jgi:hypothetical protein
MKKIILALVPCLFAGSLYAAPKTSADYGFTTGLNAVTVAAPAVEVPAVAAPVRAKTGRYVQVSGYVNLTGNGFVSGPNASYTSITLSGWASFKDSSGEVTSNNSYINTMAYMWITPNQYVFQSVNPNIYAQFYYKGKPVGSANMTGYISVSGFPGGNYVSLNGSGNMTGSIYVEDQP